MSVYTLAPSPSLAYPDPTFTTWQDAFSPEQLETAIDLGEAACPKDATIGSGSIDEAIRQCKTGWLSLRPETEFLYDSIGWVARQLNGQYYGLDLFGFVEDIQYTVYGPDGDHYDWHVDKGSGERSPRKLSLVLQLSDPSEYEGGDLEIWGENRPVAVTKQKGLIACFPAYTLHRVTPVTSGVRRSIVVWLSGPRFR